MAPTYQSPWLHAHTLLKWPVQALRTFSFVTLPKHPSVYSSKSLPSFPASPHLCSCPHSGLYAFLLDCYICLPWPSFSSLVTSGPLTMSQPHSRTSNGSQSLSQAPPDFLYKKTPPKHINTYECFMFTKKSREHYNKHPDTHHPT